MLEISEDFEANSKSAVASIDSELEGSKFGIAGTINFEVPLYRSKGLKAVSNSFYFDASANYAKEKITKISFKVMEKTGTKLDQLIWMINPTENLNGKQIAARLHSTKGE